MVILTFYAANGQTVAEALCAYVPYAEIREAREAGLTVQIEMREYVKLLPALTVYAVIN